MEYVLVIVLQVILLIIYGGVGYLIGRSYPNEKRISDASFRGGQDQIHAATRHDRTDIVA